METNLVTAVHQERTPGLLGASEAAAALGLDKYTSPLVIAKRLRGEEVEENRSAGLQEAADWGGILEPVIRGKYALDRGVAVMVPLFSFVKNDWLRATPDGLVDSAGAYMPGVNEWAGASVPSMASGLVQIKCRSAFLRDEWLEGVPTKEEIQVRVEMAVTDLPWCDVSVLLGGNQMIIHRVERDATLEANLLRDLRAFYDMAKAGKDPSPDQSEAWRREASSRMRPTKVTITADETLDEVVAYFLDCRRKRKKYEEEEDAARNDLMLHMGAAGATGIESKHGKISAYQTSGRTDWKAYALSLGAKAEPPAQFKGKPGSWAIRAKDGEE